MTYFPLTLSQLLSNTIQLSANKSQIQSGFYLYSLSAIYYFSKKAAVNSFQQLQQLFNITW